MIKSYKTLMQSIGFVGTGFVNASAVGLALLSISSQALADEAGALKTESCTEAKSLVKVMKTFKTANPKYTNQIKPDFLITMRAINGAVQPEKVYYKNETTEIELLRDETGRITNLGALATLPKSGEICVYDPTGVHAADDKEDTMEVQGNMTFYFDNTSGMHDAADLIEGGKDGSKLMNKLAPPGLGLFVPSLDYVRLVNAEDDQTDTSGLTVRFIRNGSKLDDIDVVEINGSRYISIKALKKSKASHVEIKGHAYKLEATFDPT